MNKKKNSRSKSKVKGFDLGNERVRLILVVCLLAVCLLLIWYKNNDEKKEDNDVSNNIIDHVYANVNPGIIEDKEVEGLKMTNTSLIYSKYYSRLTTLVSNPTDKDIEAKIFDIYIKDKDGNSIVKLIGYVGEVIPAGESREIESNVDMNLKDAVSIEYKIVKD